MAQIVNSTPNAVQRRLQLWRPANGPLRRRRSPADRWHLADDTRCGQRCQRYYFYVPVRRGVCPLQVQGTSLGTGPPNLGVGEAGMTGLLGNRPRAMPLRAPRVEARGRSVCRRNQAQRATDAPDTSCLPSGRSVSSATHEPPRTFAAKALAPPGGPSGISASDSTATAGHTGRDDGGEDEPEPDGS